ncbi:MAG: hypothetical protein LBO06_06825, partial [Bacteroidales bacterium]|nr:hypothetical protein [Bacteroidales bacterium]
MAKISHPNITITKIIITETNRPAFAGCKDDYQLLVHSCERILQFFNHRTLSIYGILPKKVVSINSSQITPIKDLATLKPKIVSAKGINRTTSNTIYNTRFTFIEEILGSQKYKIFDTYYKLETYYLNLIFVRIFF